MLKLFTGAAMAAVVGLSAPSVATAAAPLEAYGGLPSIESVEISPDGTALALVAMVNDERYILVKSLSGPLLASTKVAFNKIRSVQWADQDHLIIIASSTAAIEDVSYVGEQFQAVSFNIKTGKSAMLPTKAIDSVLNVVAGRVQPGVDGSNPVLYMPLYVTVARNMQSNSGHLDLYKINLDSGQALRVQMGDNDTYDYLTTSDGSVLAKASSKENEHSDNATWTLSLRKPGGWQSVFSTTSAVDTPDLWGVSPDGQSVIIDTWDEKNDTWRPTPVSLADGKLGDYIGPPVSQGGVIGPNGVVVGFSHRDDFVEYDFIEPHLKTLWPAFRAAFKGQQVSLMSWTPDYRKLVLFVTGSGTSGGYYLADTATKRVDPIGAPYPKVSPADVATVRLVHYTAADGLEIEGVLTLPKGRAEKDLPLLVFPHGGPRAHDDVTFDWWAQAMASRGYAVLQPNFRGSTGYGQKFQDAGYGEWGAKMQTDLSDGITYLAKQGVIDPKRVCIVGGSYGGYAALAGVTLQKGVYRCAVSVAGVADLKKTFGDDVLRYGEASSRIRDRKRLYGVAGVNDPKLEERSPSYQASKADAPILLIHGNDDTRVPFVQSQRMAAALKAAGKPYEFVTLGHEDHFMSTSATRKQMLSATVTFLEKNNPPN
jgi:dipeptidyl aminopeptidase/acylaminoacyl peptidase